MDIYILWILVIFSIILTCYAQVKVSSNYNRYSKVMAGSGITASVLARQILDIAGLKDIKVVRVSGTMTDYYNHKKKIIALSDGVYDSSSVSALGIVAHEVGHALQYQTGYFPIKLRIFTIFVSNLVSKLLWPMLIIGVLLDIFIVMAVPVGLYLIYGILALFVISTLVSFVTLPVEKNASNRALQILSDMNALDEHELMGAKAVLDSAGLTYVAGFVGSLVNLLRIIFILTRNSRR